MYRYSCKVRLGGTVTNEVRKTDVTAPEIIILRAIHGADAVQDIVETNKSDRRQHRVERQRLYDAYASPKFNNAETVDKKLAAIRAVLGPDMNDLPVRVPDDDPFLTARLGQKAPDAADAEEAARLAA